MTAVRVTIESGIGRIVLDRPPHNILTREMLSGLRAAIEPLGDNRAVRVLLLSAAGRNFSPGADVAEHLAPHYHALIPEFLATVAALDTFPLPVVAAVRGRCLGGGFELVQAADMIVAADNAVFGQPEIALGVFPPAACGLLPGRCPPGVAAELVLTGDAIDACEARRLGLVRHVVPAAELDTAALDLAGRMARHSGAALRLTKRALRLARPGAAVPLEHAGRLYVEQLMATEDAIEGLRAFLEKREPAWRHQ